jgi:hypothetical protein
LLTATSGLPHDAAHVVHCHCLGAVVEVPIHKVWASLYACRHTVKKSLQELSRLLNGDAKTEVCLCWRPACHPPVLMYPVEARACNHKNDSCCSWTH